MSGGCAPTSRNAWPWPSGSGGLAREAERAFGSSIAGWRAADRPTFTAYAGYHLGQIQRAQGRLDAAARTCWQALEITAPPGRPPLPAAGPAYVGLGEVAYQRNELDTALRHVTEGVALCLQFVDTAPLATGLVTLAWIRQASGDPAGALEAIGEAVRAEPGPVGLLNPVPAQHAQAAAGPGRPCRSCQLGARAGPRRRGRAGLPPRGGVSGTGPGATRPGPPRPGARAAGPAARGGRRPGPGRQRHRGRRAAATGTGSQRRGSRRGRCPGRGADAGLPARLRPGLRRRGRRRWPRCSAC